MKSKETKEIVVDHALYEKARKRAKQKKKLYYHLILFLLGSILFIVANEVLGIGKAQFDSWFPYAITVWFFIWLLHFINVFITNKFFGEDWEREHTEKLIAKHYKRLEKLEKNLMKKGAFDFPDALKKKDKPENTKL